MNGLHMRLTIALGALLLAGLLVVLASCGPGWPPSVTPEPLTEVAQPQAMPSSTTGPIVSLFQSPIQTPTPVPTLWIEPPPPTRRPTPTIPPVPTRLPTPVVTRIPTAVPRIIPLPPGQTASYTIAFRTGNLIRAIRNDGTSERVLIDVHAQVPLFLASQDMGVDTWANPSPDGTQLALVLSNVESRTSLSKGEAPEYSIYLFDLRMGILRQLVQGGIEPVWSPGGARIAYHSTRTQGLWIVDVATGDRGEIYPVDRENEHKAVNFAWAPGGQRLVLVDSVFRRSATMVVVEADGGGSVPVLVSPQAPELYFPQWSPNGDKILYVSLLGERSGPDYPYNLWIMNPDGSRQTQLTRDIDVTAGIPRWSPDGNWIVFTGIRYYEEPQPLTDLWLIDRTGTELKHLTSNFTSASNEWLATWSPDGTQLIYVTDLRRVWTLSLSIGVQTGLSATPDFIVLSSLDY